MQTVNATDNFEVNPAVLNMVGEIVLGDEFLGDVIKADAHEFWAVEGGAKVEVGNVEGAEFGTCARMLLIISLMSSSGTVLVPMTPG